HQRGDVLAELRQAIGGRVVRAGRLVLTALVNGEYPAPAVGERGQDRQEVFLAAGVARDEQRGAQLTGARLGVRLQGGERAPGAAHDGAPDPGRQLQGSWGGHGYAGAWKIAAGTPGAAGRVTGSITACLRADRLRAGAASAAAAASGMAASPVLSASCDPGAAGAISAPPRSRRRWRVRVEVASRSP